MKPLILAICVIAAPVSAQTIKQYDRAGNYTGQIVHEGTRWVQRDPAGNAQGYWQRDGQGMAHRNNAGDLISRERLAH